jgi:hypothetical protein
MYGLQPPHALPVRYIYVQPKPGPGAIIAWVFLGLIVQYFIWITLILLVV